MVKIVRQKLNQDDLVSCCAAHFKTFIKFVADINNNVLAIGGELHADAEAYLIESGSRQSDIWGGNFYPWKPSAERLEFTSFINIRPRNSNTSMEVMDSEIRQKMQVLTENLLLNENETMHVPEPE